MFNMTFIKRVVNPNLRHILWLHSAGLVETQKIVSLSWMVKVPEK